MRKAWWASIGVFTVLAVVLGSQDPGAGAQTTPASTSAASSSTTPASPTPSFAPILHTITIKSEAKTRAAAVDYAGNPPPATLAKLDAGDTSGLLFNAVDVGAFGTYTPIPPNAPAGTQVVNIPPHNGQNGFFMDTFVLPPDFTSPSLSGAANVDDEGRIFLNGHPLTPSIRSSDSQKVTEYGNVQFSTANRDLFVARKNTLLVADANTGAGPSGAAFYMTIQFESASTPIFMPLKSNATTQAAAVGDGGYPSSPTLARLDAGDTRGLTFQPASVGSYGTYTPIPPNAPAGTQVVNIPPNDGRNGFFKVTFALPTDFSSPSMNGAANVDDVGRVFLNGVPITPSMTSSDAKKITEYGGATFSTDNADLFYGGANEILVADGNTGEGPSGAAFYMTVYFNSVPNPRPTTASPATSSSPASSATSSSLPKPTLDTSSGVPAPGAALAILCLAALAVWARRR